MEEASHASDVLYALAALLAVLLVPLMVRVRLVYTFLWTAFAAVAIKMESPTALGLATAMGLSVMLAWYMLRLFDRAVFASVLLGWFGFLSNYRVFCWLANTGDFLLHFVGPLTLAANYLPHVQVWMTLPMLGYVCLCIFLYAFLAAGRALMSEELSDMDCSFSLLWVYLVAGGSLIANHVYHFSPPRSPEFWAVASVAMLVGNLAVPLGCVIANRSGAHELFVTTFQEAASTFMPYYLEIA
ncbi:hypothetical protein BBJ28_00009994 [Nothophytophthora sp. Chile5]|nr:hypothetical protein BBJ28_00009994 [Nothophytophthora sp. Chile5]